MPKKSPAEAGPVNCAELSAIGPRTCGAAFITAVAFLAIVILLRRPEYDLQRAVGTGKRHRLHNDVIAISRVLEGGTDCEPIGILALSFDDRERAVCWLGTLCHVTHPHC